MSATQLNGDYKDSETPDQNLLRGAKSIADRADVGMILLGVSEEDLAKLEPILEANPNLQRPNIKLSVYKNRRGSYKGVFLWCTADLGTCRIHPQFCTTWHHEMVGIEDIRLNALANGIEFVLVSGDVVKSLNSVEKLKPI